MQNYYNEQKPNGARFFCENILGLISLCVIALTTIGMFLVSGSNMMIGRLTTMVWDNYIWGLPLCIGAALTIKARGLDLSLAYMINFSAIMYVTTGSIVIAIISVVLFGAVNGALTVYLKLPATLVSIVTGLLLYSIGLIVSEGASLTVGDGQYRELSKTVAPIVAFILLAGAFVYNMLTSLGKPVNLRPKSGLGVLTEFLAYPAAALCAGVSGILMAIRLGVVYTGMGGQSYFMNLIFIWAVINASKWFSGKYLPLVCAAVAMLLIRMLEMSLAFLNASIAILYVVQVVIVLPIMIAAGFAKWPFGKEQLQSGSSE